MNILLEALHDLATVYSLLLGEDQDKLCSPDIIKAVMTELTSMTCLLQGNLQKRQNQLDSSSSMKGGGQLQNPLLQQHHGDHVSHLLLPP